MGRRKKRFHGFTLIELMMVSAIVGLLAAIALPKFGDAIVRSREAVVKGKLGSLRSAASIYYADNEGLPPFNNIVAGGNSFTTLVPKYLEAVPEITIPRRHTAGGKQAIVEVNDSVFGSFGGNVWTTVYSNDKVHVNCTHLDSSGRIWSTW